MRSRISSARTSERTPTRSFCWKTGASADSVASDHLRVYVSRALVGVLGPMP